MATIIKLILQVKIKKKIKTKTDLEFNYSNDVKSNLKL